MPSYLEKEQIAPMQPFIANTNAIMNTFNTKVQYWAAGAAQVKSAYDRYLGMDLTREDNQQGLRTFMSNAKDQMKKVVQTDISIGDNQVQAMGVFDPLVNGQSDFSRNILGDNAITSHYKSQLSTAESYRTRDGGKEFSQTNVDYLMQHLNDFKNEKTADAWKQYYGNRRFYTPYYDYTKEIRELMDAYKPSHVLKTVPEKNSLYLHTIEDKSRTSDDVLRYINANLSDNAKRQMAIEASTSWYGRDKDLISSVRADWDAETIRYSGRDKELEAKIRLTTDPMVKANLEAEQSLVRKRIANINSNIDSFNKGDFSEITKNKDSYAVKLYTGNLLDSVATGYANTDYTEKYAPDQAAIQLMDESGRNLRFKMQMEFDGQQNQLDRQNALDIAAMRESSKNKNTPGSPTYAIPNSGDTETGVNLSDSDKQSFTLTGETLDNDLALQNQTQQEVYGVIHDRLVSAGKITKVDDPQMRESVVKEYLKKINDTYDSYMKDPNVAKSQNPDGTAKLLMEREFFPGVMEAIDQLKESSQIVYAIKSVKEKMANDALPDIQALAEKGYTTLRYTDDTPGNSRHLWLDAKHVADFVIRGDNSVIYERTVAVQVPETRIEAMGDTKSPVPTGRMKTEMQKQYFYNSKRINPNDITDMISKVNSTVNKKYDADLVQNKTIYRFGPNSQDKLKVAKQEILNNVTHKEKELKETDFQVIGYSPDGNLYFKGDGKIVGAKEKTKDFDGRYIYELPTSLFKLDGGAQIPPNAQGLKYFFDKQMPFLSPGKTISTPHDSNFFQVQGVKYRVEAEKNIDGSITYNLYDLDNSKFITRQYDFYSLVEFANTYPTVKNQVK
jgi:hypothetical protein